MLLEPPPRWVARALGLAAVSALPPLHVLALSYLWSDYSRVVSRNTCSCSCWDTVFKGPYETGVASYKHMYFNATSNSLRMWLVVAAGAVTLYECVRHLAALALAHRTRPEMALLFAASLYAHYYSWWGYINYYNDDFYTQWYHQLFFTVTEVLSTGIVLHLADKKNSITSQKVLVICGIAALHILVGSWDQFINNVIRGNGEPHQVMRDVGLMVPDVLHVTLPPLSARRDAGAPPRRPRARRLLLQLTLTAACVLAGFQLSVHL